MSLESNKTLGGIGALLIAIGSIVPIIGIVGIILVMIAMKGLAEPYHNLRHPHRKPPLLYFQ